MRKGYYLKSCSTCQRINKEIGADTFFETLQNIKEEAITETQLDELKELAGSYEALFSRTAMKYKSLGLKNQTLTEEDYKKYILEEYTFLKRPVFVIQDQIFVGNSKKNVEALKQAVGI